MDRGRRLFRRAGEAAIGTCDARHAKRPVRTHDHVLRHGAARLHGTEREQLRAHGHFGHHAALDVHRYLGRLRIVGDEDQLPFHVASRGFRPELQAEVVDRLPAAVRGLRELDFEVRVDAPHVLDLPGRAADVRHAHASRRSLAEIDVAEIDERRIKRHIATDIARDPELHLGEERLVERDRERRAVLPEERPRVELRHHLGRLVRLEIALRHLGRRTSAARPHADDVQVFLVHVSKDEPILCLRPLGHRPEIVARDGEHLVGPLLGLRRFGGARHHERGDDHLTDDRPERAGGGHGCSSSDRRSGLAEPEKRLGEAYGGHGWGVKSGGYRKAGKGGEPEARRDNYPMLATVRRLFGRVGTRKFRPGYATTDTLREVPYNGKVCRTLRTGCHRGPAESAGFLTTIHGGVPVSTGWQEVQIACRGWSAGHVKSRPSFNCRSSVFSGCLTKQPRAMAPVGRASQSVAKSDSPRFTAWYGRG